MQQQSLIQHSGLTHPDEFRDNCGFGLIAHMDGVASHRLLQTAIESLTCMTHRGGIAADGKTGDGCGLLLQKPDSFFRALVSETFHYSLSAVYGIGMVFLSREETRAQQAREAINELILAHGLKLVGWRLVPTDASVLGPIALESLPQVEQVIIDAPGLTEEQANRTLFLVRRWAEKKLADDADFYISSFSASVVVYKGLMMPADLPVFYSDLGNPQLETAICVFHQRFSTNTLPRWPLAQPFRFLAHNGEINSIMGNRNWSMARIHKFNNEHLPDLEALAPLVNRTGSDSSSMDNMLELLVAGGMDLFRAIRMMVPPAWQNMESMDPELRAFYEYNAMHMEPWDGPAGIVLTDGRYAVCFLDRNGLRPARWVITRDRFITLASEVGTYHYAPEDVIAKGRVGPGQILAVDTQTGEVLHTPDIDKCLKAEHPYKIWLKQNAVRLGSSLNEEIEAIEQFDKVQLNRLQKMFQVTAEERNEVLRALAETGQEAVGSMGDDTPMAVLSQKVRPLTDYFRQQFAQVTNPPIDPLREAIVMSLETCLGVEHNIFEQTPEHARRLILASPVLSHSRFQQIIGFQDQGFAHQYFDLNYEQSLGLQTAIEQLCDAAETAVRNGKALLILSDRHIAPGKLPIHAALATGAVHHRLTQKGLRCDSNLIIETAVARDPHHFAVLLGYGATAIYPYLTYDILCDMVRLGTLLENPIEVHKNYRKGITKGLLKILSKMGIAAVASYRGAQLFEIIGLSREVVGLCFTGSASRINGATFTDLEHDQILVAQHAWSDRKPIGPGGLLKYVHDAEYHAFNPDVVQTLHVAVKSGRFEDYLIYANTVNGRGVATLRDLLKFKETIQPIPLEQVEPIEKILVRFDSAGMSLGALSPEAHEAIAMAMNQLGGRSNSGEGGEDPARYGTNRVSKIKQVASGRFGVTPEYLMSAEVLQIKIAQGAKPGEGGQLPGGKVNALIARLRYSVPGVTLISPPPHHDIYSIEDLAQLIFDLKQVNPAALVSVKLVSEPGVGTIAAGVAKAYADFITISGYDGGTAASPLTSIRYAGSPWELGLSEAQQALRMNGLRSKVRLQTDGGLKTGLDVVKAAALGAESFGFGTVPMVALGCKYLRICHLNNCATGVATQQKELRDNYFIGEVEMLVNYFKFLAMDTREWLARLGCSSLEELIGRTDLLEQIEGLSDKQRNLDLSDILYNSHIKLDAPQFYSGERNHPYDKGELAEHIMDLVRPAIENKTGGTFEFPITNCNRSIGARLSGEIAKQHGNQGMANTPITLKFTGTAGQSFGVWNAGGVHLHLEGDANDYVGKGLAGGKIVIRPPQVSRFNSNETAIVGNTCLYGATGGRFFAAGRAGERFGVRNSGVHAVVEGAGDHCCEYMTGGLITVLGATGYNFGAGMTGGFAYVLDEANTFVDKANRELIDILRIHRESTEDYRNHLFSVIKEFVGETGSAWGAQILDQFDDYVAQFWLVKPKAASLEDLLNSIRSNPG